ncbi:MAG: MerR family DNA-binding transcriptional regulator [Calditrichaeota bacterium]|nr:MAG: MerR family DNA-binding transcriptional regulator [Calditrichota bacterium]MBL1207774.1 MerR family DNA-binding transcriptional regulator [Calditrichota bacterium]NOG47607.1 MerR family DNA-binding transcriptional regulator [Calditrichota bacterium]
MENYITIKEAAKKLGVSKETLRRWDKTGKFNSIRHPINNYRVYKDEQLNSFVKDIAIQYEAEPINVKDNINPFFETSFGKLYNLDVVSFFKTLKDETIDLIIADPPYNIKKAEWDTFQSQKEYVDWSMIWIKEAHRVLKKNGTIYIFGFSEILADLKWSANHLFKGSKWLIWYYRNKANLGTDWGRSHESILHFRKSKNFIFNIDEVRIPYNQHTLKYPKRKQAETSQYNNGNGKKYIWEPNPKGAKPKDVFEIPTISNSAWEKTEHPTQKPIELIRKCVLSSSNPDSIIIDPFGGSGTTYAVAEAFQRNWLGTELDKKYCEITMDRLNDNEHINRISLVKDEYENIERRKKLRKLS